MTGNRFKYKKNRKKDWLYCKKSAVPPNLDFLRILKRVNITFVGSFTKFFHSVFLYVVIFRSTCAKKTQESHVTGHKSVDYQAWTGSGKGEAGNVSTNGCSPFVVGTAHLSTGVIGPSRQPILQERFYLLS